MGWREVFQLQEKEEQGKQVTVVSEQVTLLSHIPLFQERAAIREFEGNQSRVEAELGAIEEVVPYLEMLNDQQRLIIPDNTSGKYRYWQGGQSIEATLRELGASEETICRYIGDQNQGGPK